MKEHIGYYKKYTHSTTDNGIIFFVGEELPIYKDKVPTEKDGDCIRFTLVDGTLVVEKWMAEKCRFTLLTCTNNFRIDNCIV